MNFYIVLWLHNVEIHALKTSLQGYYYIQYIILRDLTAHVKKIPSEPGTCFCTVLTLKPVESRNFTVAVTGFASSCELAQRVAVRQQLKGNRAHYLSMEALKNGLTSFLHNECILCSRGEVNIFLFLPELFRLHRFTVSTVINSTNKIDTDYRNAQPECALTFRPTFLSHKNKWTG